MLACVLYIFNYIVEIESYIGTVTVPQFESPTDRIPSVRVWLRCLIQSLMNCWQMGATHKTETPKTNGKLHVSALKHIKTLTLFFTPTCDTVNRKTNDTSY